VLLACLIVGLTAVVASDTRSAAAADSTRPLPAGRTPSAISKEVCSREAQKDMAETLGVKAVVSKPTWVNHAYACQYRYATGSFALTVKELSSWPQTYAHYNALARQLGRVKNIRNLGQGSYQTKNGTVIVRKDWKILTVDISGLPTQFGDPPTSRSDVAVTVADVILACWAGD
jgi:hypothetical protein